MFAVIKTGGKQYRVSEGDKLNVELINGLHGDILEAGDTVTFSEVLLVDDGKKATVGTPLVSGASVEAKFIETGKDKKVRIQKFKSKSNYDKVTGHRQKYDRVEITKIKA